MFLNFGQSGVSETWNYISRCDLHVIIVEVYIINLVSQGRAVDPRYGSISVLHAEDTAHTESDVTTIKVVSKSMDLSLCPF